MERVMDLVSAQGHRSGSDDEAGGGRHGAQLKGVWEQQWAGEQVQQQALSR